MRSRFLIGDTEHEVWLSRRGGGYRLHGERSADGVDVALDERARTLRVAETSLPVLVAVSGDDLHVHLDGHTHLVRYLDPVLSLAGDAANGSEDAARAPMPGTVLAVHVQPGSAVALGDALVAIESMKLETTVRATRAGAVEAVHVREGQSFERDQVLITLAKAG